MIGLCHLLGDANFDYSVRRTCDYTTLDFNLLAANFGRQLSTPHRVTPRTCV
jgi:hypothetical protein